jgi:hypothetical protein
MVTNSSGSVTSDWPAWWASLVAGLLCVWESFLYGRSAILGGLSQPVLARHTPFAATPAATAIAFAAAGLLLLWRRRAGTRLAIGIVTLLLGVRILILILARIMPSTIAVPFRSTGFGLSPDLVLKLGILMFGTLSWWALRRDALRGNPS